MATHFHPASSRATPRAAAPALRCREIKNPFFLYSQQPRREFKTKIVRISRIRAVDGEGGSYLDMWKKAVDRQRKSLEFERMAESSEIKAEQGDGESDEEMERKSSEFQKLLEVSSEERDRVQKMLVIDRAAAAIAAARALLKENPPAAEVSVEIEVGTADEDIEGQQTGAMQNGSLSLPQSDMGTPGPSFWAWAPPMSADGTPDENEIKPAGQASPSPAQSRPIMEKDRGLDFLAIPFETSMFRVPLPPLQSSVEVTIPHVEEEQELGVQFSANAAEAADALSKVNEALSEGVAPDGSMWWKETGIEQRPDGVVCKWTLTRGVSADKSVEWENKYWEAADELGYKELGSEKSGRDAVGNVWREYWRESMMQIDGIVHLEKTADKWGKNIQGDEWQEQWSEHYGAGKAEKWAHKWCSIDPNTPLDAGHAHVWHERWGETYDGEGGSEKYTDKWAERFEGEGWSKWGDKWDEHFDPNGHGVKQGETWWQGKYGERWNRTWGEGHNGSGWVHKYGKSSSGEHWDTHVPQETWYERFPHYGFYHCFENAVQLREVQKPSEWS